MPCWVRRSASTKNAFGSMTMPLPSTHVLPRCTTPDGNRCSTNDSSPTWTEWPALCPPWYRTTISNRSASRSTILPLPSSPHWAPITAITFAIGHSELRDFPVQLDVLLRRSFPGVVDQHSVTLNLLP